MTAEIIEARLNACGIAHEATLASQLLTYHELLVDWNTRMDLTAVTDELEMLDRHDLDSLMALNFPGLIPEEGTLIDVGTGAGLPGIPLALARPRLRVTLLDAQQKRLQFLQAVIDALHLTNVTLVHARAEDGGRNSLYRERFDIAVARAVAPLPVLAEYLLPYVRTGGLALAWKGPGVAEELTQGRRAAHLLGGRLEEAIPVVIPGRDWAHMLVPIRKAQATSSAYPRKAGTPGKKPLGTA